MKDFFKTFELRWSDVDANGHVMHSRYYELGAHCRMSFLIEHGLTVEVMQQYRVGPILFREECIFRRELNAGETVTVHMLLTKCKANASRWSVRHEVKKADGTVAAVINADLAWLDLGIRKLAPPPPMAVAIVEELAKADDFILLD
jgi:acyl-CoA thioester hydrolase